MGCDPGRCRCSYVVLIEPSSWWLWCSFGSEGGPFANDPAEQLRERHGRYAQSHRQQQRTDCDRECGRGQTLPGLCALPSAHKHRRATRLDLARLIFATYNTVEDPWRSGGRIQSLLLADRYRGDGGFETGLGFHAGCGSAGTERHPKWERLAHWCHVFGYPDAIIGDAHGRSRDGMADGITIR